VARVEQQDAGSDQLILTDAIALVFDLRERGDEIVLRIAAARGDEVAAELASIAKFIGERQNHDTMEIFSIAS